MLDAGRMREAIRPFVLPTLMCVIVLVLATKGIMSEASIAFNGDMPRYLMNGVYLLDLLRDGVPPAEVMHHARLYFAQYPALTLGHHPVMLPLAEVPFFAVMGISVAAGRVTILCFLLLGLVCWFCLVKATWGEKVAFWSSLLFASSLLIVNQYRLVMSEIPALSMIMVSMWCYYRFSEYGKTRDLVLLVVSIVVACYAKQLAVFVLPIFIFHFALRKGLRALFSGRLLAALAVLVVLLMPLLLITIRFSSANVAWIVEANKATSFTLPVRQAYYFLERMWVDAFFAPVVALGFIGMAAAIVLKRKEAVLFLLWIAISVALIIYVRVLEPRMAVYWLPPFALFAVLSAHLVASARFEFGIITPSRAAVALWALVIGCVGYQVATSYAEKTRYTEGYEEAAKYVTANPKGATILFSSSVDTGYFVFFVRKHDPARRHFVFRANKVLATSFYNETVEENITNVDEIYQLLRDYGTCHIVAEDAETDSTALNWLRQELQTSKFVLKKRIALKSREPTLQGVSLLIYEYKDCTPPRLDAPLDMNLPLGGMSINLKVGDLLK